MAAAASATRQIFLPTPPLQIPTTAYHPEYTNGQYGLSAPTQVTSLGNKVVNSQPVAQARDLKPTTMQSER